MTDQDEATLDSVASDPPCSLNARIKAVEQASSPLEKVEAADELLQAARVLQGPPVADLKGDEAPDDGFPSLRKWATDLFAASGNVAVNPKLGQVTMDGRSVRDSMAHKMTRHKAAAFAAVKPVLEKGAVVAHAVEGNVDSYFVSAPVNIGGIEDVVTVLVKRSPEDQRMYVHSVATKKYLLEPQDSGTDTVKASGHTGKLTPADVRSVLHEALTVKMPPDTALDSLRPLARVRLAQAVLDSSGEARRRLAILVRLQAAAVKLGAASGLARVKLAREVQQLLAELGTGAAESEHIKLLREVVAGEHDAEGFADSYGMLQEAINALEEAGALVGEVEALAHQAITHWAEREEEFHG